MTEIPLQVKSTSQNCT